MRYKVITYGNSLLRKKSVPVKKINAAVKQLVKDMLETMYSSSGVGLAAEQVGRTEAVCVIDVAPHQDVAVKDGPRLNPDVVMPLVLINPVIVATSGDVTLQEGCLSFPEIFADIKRPAELSVRFLAPDDKGEQTVCARGLLARAILHEMDHLNGVLLVDRMSAVQKIAVAGQLRRIKKAAKAEKAK